MPTEAPDLIRQYDIRNAAAFKKTTEQWGALSNMASGFPLTINGINIRSSEALYQACRYPTLPEVQEKIIAQASPMTAKMVGKPYLNQCRPDWMGQRIIIMKWCLRVKLAQNWESFSQILLNTDKLPIVELSTKDSFWGTKFEKDHLYTGVNALGRLLMGLREQVQIYDKKDFMLVKPPSIENFQLYSSDIGVIRATDKQQVEEPQLNLLS